MPVKNLEAERARCRAYYAKHSDTIRARRKKYYYDNLEHERSTAAARMRGYVKPKPKPPEKRVNAMMKLDDRWARWANEAGFVL